MVWGLFRTKKVKPAAGKTGYWRTVWRRVRDSNPRSLSGHSISSAAPSTTRTTLQGLSQHQNYLGKRGELMGRTSKNIKFRIPEKPRKIKGFRLGGYRTATTISSQPRYDRFDTPPRLKISINYYKAARSLCQHIFASPSAVSRAAERGGCGADGWSANAR